MIAASLLTFDRALAADQCAALTKERQAAISPEDALNKLKAGNERFVSRNMRNCDLLEQVRATAGGQFPSAVVVGCIDSRVRGLLMRRSFFSNSKRAQFATAVLFHRQPRYKLMPLLTQRLTV